MEVCSWKAILSNGEEFHGSNMSSWRILKKHCTTHGLTIRSLLHDGEEVDTSPGVVAYFVMFDRATGLMSSASRTRICYGSILRNGKARLKWRVIEDTFMSSNGNYTEIVPEVDTVWEDVSVPVRR